MALATKKKLVGDGNTEMSAVVDNINMIVETYGFDADSLL